MNKRFELIKFRNKLGLNQAQFAEKMGFSACYYSLVEGGIREGSLQFWKALQDTYNVPDSNMYGLIKLETGGKHELQG